MRTPDQHPFWFLFLCKPSFVHSVLQELEIWVRLELIVLNQKVHCHQSTAAGHWLIYITH